MLSTLSSKRERPPVCSFLPIDHNYTGSRAVIALMRLPSPFKSVLFRYQELFFMDIIQAIRNFVESECKKPESRYGREPFLFHFAPTAEYAGRLADELGGDMETVVLAAWLHDIGAIVHGRKDHHLTGAKIAEKKLKALGYPPEKIKLVKNCILRHRGSQRSRRGSLEEQILAEADAISNFENIPGIFKAAFVYEKLDQGRAKEAVRKKLENKWKQLRFEKSKELIRPKYEAAMLLFR